MQKSGIGVVGDNHPSRSVMDQKMQKIYGTGNIELYNNIDFGPRSEKDMYMQRTYNLFYEDYCPCMSMNVNCPCVRLARGRCMKNTCPCMLRQENYECPYAKITDDPYNKYSYDVKRLPLI